MFKGKNEEELIDFLQDEHGNSLKVADKNGKKAGKVEDSPVSDTDIELLRKIMPNAAKQLESQKKAQAAESE